MWINNSNRFNIDVTMGIYDGIKLGTDCKFDSK